MPDIPRQGTHAIQRIRAKLRAKDPRCHWCGVVTLDPRSHAFHKDCATVDHVKGRFECKSFEEYSAESNHVLACLECNQTRDRIFLMTEKPWLKAAQERKRAEDAKRGPCIEKILAPAAWQSLAP